ncbi:vacuolar-type H+-ATPase subunit H [Streptomyces umbrinus]|uniref:ATP synthase F0 subunit B n=1 Tax=Streptomyces umbrinus TaxID=67370 RepID=UPI00167E17EC|nr:ATP synthase F0 subunit B [Streptomyces umbrinus]MCR3732325.1 vacuolar-type H+-ATPase subunit H [Streptomyces umbrinus]GHH68057.1 hypothetical protein GCM10018775_92330 [Streptomyces umbrinus]
MNPVDDKEGMQQDGMSTDITLNSAQETDGFAAIMKRLKGRSAQERAALKVQADQAVLGYEAYALGHEYLERGELDAARRWLQVAAGHHVPGAEQVLEELAERPTLNDVAALTAISTAVIVDTTVPRAAPHPSDVCPTDGSRPGKNERLWAAAVERNLHAAQQTASARASAAQITEQARREADELLAQAQRQAKAIVDDAHAEAGRIRDAAHQQVAEKKEERAAVPDEVVTVQHRSGRPLYVSRVSRRLLASEFSDPAWSGPELRGLESPWVDVWRHLQLLPSRIETAQTDDLPVTCRYFRGAQNPAEVAIREQMRTALQSRYCPNGFDLLLVVSGTALRSWTQDRDGGPYSAVLWPSVLARCLENEEDFDRPDLLLRAVRAYAANTSRMHALKSMSEDPGNAAADIPLGPQGALR